MYKKNRSRLVEKKKMILETAKKILIKSGKNTTMSDIAKYMEMDTTTLYYYYKSIAEIIDSILDQEYHDFSLNNIKRGNTTEGHLSIIKEMVTMILEFYYDNLEIMQIILTQVCPTFIDPDHEEDSVAINHYIEGYRQANSNMLKEIKLAIKKKEFHTKLPPELILQIIRGSIFGVCAAWMDEKTPREMIPEIVQLIFSPYTP